MTGHARAEAEAFYPTPEDADGWEREAVERERAAYIRGREHGADEIELSAAAFALFREDHGRLDYDDVVAAWNRLDDATHGGYDGRAKRVAAAMLTALTTDPSVPDEVLEALGFGDIMRRSMRKYGLNESEAPHGNKG